VAQLSDDCFVPGEGLIDAEVALEMLETRLAPIVGTETVRLDAASGRILATDLVAGRDVPPHDNSAVDGYAVWFDDLDPDGETVLPVADRIAAGHAAAAAPARGTAVRIFTGAPIPGGPDGPDTVLMQEDCRAIGSDDAPAVTIPAGIARGANRRSRGEDIAAGTTVLRGGARLRPQDIGLAASLGHDTLDVFTPLTVGVMSTGDEVHEPGTDVPAGGIYDANRHALAALLGDLGCTVRDLGIIPDDCTRITEALRGAAKTCDTIVSSAGMSVGEEDHLAAAVGELGALHFWKVAIKPGRPVAFGQVAGTPFIGLPGNPAAMMVTFLRMARPALLRMAGATDVRPRFYPVQAGFSHAKKARRREYLRVSLSRTDDGALVAHKYPRSGAGILSSLVESDGLVELPAEMTQLTPGTVVSYLPFTEVAR
jgi:molybdopterin molybdotransferase